MKRLIAAFVLLSLPAFAQQTLLQGGAFSAGHVPMYLQGGGSQPVVGDSGTAAGGTAGTGLSELGLTYRRIPGSGALGSHDCAYDAPTSTGSYHYLCLDANAQGAGLVAYGAIGSATHLPLNFYVNGNNSFSVSETGITYSSAAISPTNINYQEPGYTPIFLPGWINMNFTNGAVNDKHGIFGEMYVTTPGSPTNANLLELISYMPPDNGGDVSGIYTRQTGGGNALSAFNLCSQRPSGFTAYCSQGFAIEAQVDGTKSAIFAAALGGDVFKAVMNGSAAQGLSVLPVNNSFTGSRAIHVANADNSSEKFYVTLGGNVGAAGSIAATSGFTGFNAAPNPVYTATTDAQVSYYALMRSASSRGLQIQSNDDSHNTAFALATLNAAGSDLFTLTVAGAMSTPSSITALGGYLGFNGGGSAIFQASTQHQPGFFASLNQTDSLGLFVQPATTGLGSAHAILIQDESSVTKAQVNVDGSATFTSLSVNSVSVKGALSGTTGSIGGGSLANGACASGTVGVTSSTTAMAVAVSPAGGTDPGDGYSVRGYVSAAGTVTVKVCNATGGSGTPSATTYNVRVIQ